MAEEKTEEKKKFTRPKNWYGGTKSFKSRHGHRNAKLYYNDAVDKLRNLQSRLSAIYKDPNIANRQFELKKLETEYGTSDFAKVITDLRAQKDYAYQVLSSRYVSTPDFNILGAPLKQFPHSALNFHSDNNIPLSKQTKYQPTFADDDKIKLGNHLNPYYDEFYDHDSKKAENTYKKAGSTKEEYIEQWTNEYGFPEDVLQFINPKNTSAYVDPSDGTDLWGRYPSDPNFGINPAFIAGRKDNENKNKNKNSANEFDQTYGIEEGDDDDDDNDDIIDNNAVDKKKIDKVDESNDIKNNKNIEEVTPNRDDLMAKRFKERAAEIENKPSRIQQGLMEDPRWTSDRLAKLGIKDQDFQKAKGNKELMIQFKKDKAAGVYS